MNKTITEIPNGTYTCNVRGVRVSYAPTVKIELSFDISDGEYKNYFTNNWIPLFDNEFSLNLSFSPLSYVEDSLYIRIIRMFEDSNPGFRFISHESLLGKSISVVINNGIKKLLPIGSGDR
jgi:hypothetical protein